MFCIFESLSTWSFMRAINRLFFFFGSLPVVLFCGIAILYDKHFPKPDGNTAKQSLLSKLHSNIYSRSFLSFLTLNN